MHWTEDRRTETEKKEDFIKQLIKAGTLFSRQCRNCWTGERFRSYLRYEEFCGNQRHLIIIAGLKGKPLLDYANVADLHGFYLGADDQHQWDEKRWEKEIRSRME